MNWKTVVRCLLIALAVIRVPQVVHDLGPNSQALGEVAALVLVVLGGIWLIHSPRQKARRSR